MVKEMYVLGLIGLYILRHDLKEEEIVKKAKTEAVFDKDRAEAKSGCVFVPLTERTNLVIVV